MSIAAASQAAEMQKFRPVASGIARDYIVVLQDVPADKVPDTANALARQYGAIVTDMWKLALRGFRAEMSDETASAMSTDRRVRYIEQNVPMYPSGSRPTNTQNGVAVKPKDGNGADNGDYPLILGDHKLWHLWRLSHRDRSNDFTYTYESDGTDVRIFVVDYRVIRFHQEFVRNDVSKDDPDAVHNDPANYPRVQYLPGSDQTVPLSQPSDDSNPAANDVHGTAMASVAAGRNVGVASGATIVPVRVNAPEPADDSTAFFVRAFEWILGQTADHKPAVVTMSTYRTISNCQAYENTARCKVDGAAGNDGAFLAFEEAVQSVLNNGIPVVASANNNARDACNDTPARLSQRGGIGGFGRFAGGVITVGALAKDGDWRYVNDIPGNNDASNYGPCIDIWAPGEKIASAALGAWNAYRADVPSGTSYATPMVAGLIARMLQESPDLQTKLGDAVERPMVPGLVWQRLRDAATPFDQLPNLPDTTLDDSRRNRLVGADAGLNTLEASNNTTRAAVLASSDRIAYMGAFSLKTQPESIPLTTVSTPMSAIPAAGPATQTEWFRGSEATPFTTKTDTDQSLCFGKKDDGTAIDGCEAPSVNTTYRARVTRAGGFTTESATATVVVDKPIIKSHPENRWIKNDGTATLSVGVLAPAGMIPAIQWKTVDGQSAGTGPSITVTPVTSRGYFAEVTGDGVTLTSNVAFVRVEACTPPQITAYFLDPPLGDFDSTLTVNVIATGTRLEYRWYSGNTGDTSHPLVDGDHRYFEQGNSVTLAPGAHQKVWVRVSDGNGCAFVDTPAIDVSDPIACGAKPSASNTGGQKVLKNAQRVLSARGVTDPDGATYRWFREVNHVLQPLPGATAQQATMNVAVTEDATYRALVSNPTILNDPACARITDPVVVDMDDAAQYPKHVNILAPITVTSFAGRIVTFKDAFKPALPVDYEYFWFPRGSDLYLRESPPPECDPSCTTNCPTPCVPVCPSPCPDAVRAATISEFLRLRTVKLDVTSYIEDSEQIFLQVFPCGTPNFPITVEACPPNEANCYRRLVAPATDNGTYRWYQGLNVTDPPYQTTTVPELLVPAPVAPVRYFVEVTDPNCNTTATRSAYVTVGCTLKQRAVHSPGLASGSTVITGSSVLLSVDDDHDGTTFQWYEGSDTTDTSHPLGTGASITVRPLATTSYWVRATKTCDGVSGPKDSDFFVIQVVCNLAITRQPEPAVSTSGSVSASVEAIAGGAALSYQWYSRNPEVENDPFHEDGTSATYTLSGTAPAHRDVYVRVSAGTNCTVESRIVRLSLIPSVEQHIFGYTPGATVYSPSLPQKLIVTMDPQEGPDHVYAYSWYRDDGTPGGQQLTDNTLDREINVTTSSIDTFWVIVRGTHTYNEIQYYEYTTSKRMYVDLYGTCVLPPLKVTQSHVTIDLNTSPDVVLNAFCDWYDVEFEWYGGQTGDTRYPVNSDLGKPDQLTVATGSIDPYWVRAKRGCGAFVDSPTITFRRGECGPTMINQDVASVEVPYGGTAYLHVDPLAVDRPSHRWYQNEGQETPVDDDDQIPTTLKLPNVQKSGRYWVLVRNLDCSNGDESYMATVRVASHPNLTPPAWQTEVWTDSGTRATLNATSANATHYQWFAGEVGDERPGRRIDNEMFATYQTPPLTSEAKYWARVYAGTAGNLDSPTMTVRICERARIVNTSPTQLNLLPGQATYLDVTAAGTGLTYQWYKGGTPGVVAGATPIGFAIDRLLIQPTQTTTYWLLVTGHCGSGGTDTSAVWATFTASVCPLVENPTSAKPTVMPGATTTLSITATGYALQYQWYTGTPGSDTAIDGATSATVPTPPINAPTSFWCKVTSGSCSRNSEAVVVGLCGEPTVRWMTGNKNVSKGEVVDFIIDADHSTETPMVTVYAGPAGNVTASTVLVPAQPVYHFTQTFTATTTLWARAVVDNCHADTGNITVTVCIPKITTQPAAASITAGSSTTLTVGTDIPPASYQWYIGETGDISTPVSNETGPSLTVSPTVSMKYWVRVKGCGSSEADSIAALVSVCTPATIASHSQSQWLTKGATRELTVDGHGTDLTYRWYRGTAGNTANQIGNSFSVFVTPTDTTSYWARVSNGCGSADTATIVVSVCATPVITAQPASQKIFSGTTATLSVTATQATSTAMSYQWYRGTGTANPVGTSSQTFVTPALTADTTYWVRITAGTCSVDSAPAAITMCAYSQTVNAPDDRDISAGQTVRLSVNLSPVPQQVRWYRGVQGDRTNLVSTLSYADVAPTATTQYWGEFTHDGCAMKSRTVTVFVSIPTITQQPADVQVNNGQTATLTVAADTAGVMYQWFSGTSGSGTAISGATSASFTTPAMTTTTSYWARVTGSRGHVVNSNTAVVSVCVPASISQEPASSSIRRGSSASLSVTAGGTNLRYQWYRATAPSETNPSGTAASISVSPTDPSNYWVKVTSDCGTKNSATATVSVCIDPTINTQPASQTIYSGTTATLSVTATAGTALPLSYQWYSGTSGTGTAISGATSATFTTPALTATANHWVKVTSGVCSINSNTATITMCAYNATLNAPDDRDVAVGGTVRLSVNLSPVPQSGKWFRGAQGDRTNQISSYTFADVAPTATTQYWGELTHDGCTTKTRTVTVYVSVPTITQQPAAATQVNPNTSATLTVAANTAGVTYQWYSGTSGTGTPISGATGTSYVTPALASGSAASFWVKVTGSRGHVVNSNTASVTWCEPASISYQPFSRSIRRGSSVSMTVTASGTNLRYQWYRATSPNEVNGIASATSSQYDIVPLDTVAYWVRVTSDCGVAYSTTAQIDVCLDPTINTHPASQNVNSGGTATLSVSATANTTLGLTYQWYSGTSGSGTAVPGATGATFTTPALTAAANYWVKVTSGVCSTNSNTATISICSYPATLNSPSDRNVRAGVATLLSVSLNPTPQTWKWYRGAQGDRTNLISTQPAVNVYPTVTTQYWGELTNNGCTTKTRTVTIKVCVPTITAQPQSATISYGTSTTLSVSATEAVTYQWYKGNTGQAISGATSATYTTPVLYNDESYWVRITGSCGVSTDSGDAYVTVN